MGQECHTDMELTRLKEVQEERENVSTEGSKKYSKKGEKSN